MVGNWFLQIKDSMEVKCDNCGVYFNRKPSQIAKYSSHYCSIGCRQINMNAAKNSGRFELKHEDQVIGDTVYCVKCKEYKHFSEFHKRSGMTHRMDRNYKCKTCSKHDGRVDYIRNAELKRNRRRDPNVFLSDIIQHAKSRKRAEIGFDLDIEYCIDLLNNQNHKCAISGVGMTTITGEGSVNTNISIDRIDSALGYIKGNVQFVCRIVNIMKTNLNSDDFLEWCKTIVNNNKNDIRTKSN